MPDPTLYLTSDQELGAVADAIRAKGGTSEPLEYPDEFVEAIDAIETNPELQDKSVTPTESAQQVMADEGYDGLGTVSVGAVSPTYVGSGIQRRSSTDMTVSDDTVTAPTGYYESAGSKSVAAGTITNNTSGGSSSGTINRGSQIKIGKGYYKSDRYYTAQSNSGTKTISGSGTTSVDGYANASVAAGSATTPATTITVAPSISIDSAGKITASNSGSKSVTPSVSAGWVSSGTAGTVSVNGSNTKQMTTKGATTYNASTSDQTIASGTYLTGTQTIRKITTSNISAGNIKKGVTIQVGDSGSATRIANVTGTVIPANPETTEYLPFCIIKNIDYTGIGAVPKYRDDVSNPSGCWQFGSTAYYTFSFRVPFPVTITGYEGSNLVGTVNLAVGTTYGITCNRSMKHTLSQGSTTLLTDFYLFKWAAT